MGAFHLTLFFQFVVTTRPSLPDTVSPHSRTATQHLVEHPLNREDTALARKVGPGHAALIRLLPGALTWEPDGGVAYERTTDAARYDRVQGLSLGLGYRVAVPGVSFTAVYATARYGFSDERITGRLTLKRDGPGGRLLVSGFREIGDLDPFSPGHTLGNTLNALVAGHDNGDYSLIHGGLIGFETSLATGIGVGIGAEVEEETSVARTAKSAVNDALGGSGLFPPNPAVDEGTFGRGWIRLAGLGRTRWSLTVEVTGGEGRSTGRVYGNLLQDVGGSRGVTLRLKTGIATRPAFERALFRLGGLETVRGFDYGTRRGRAFWAAQLDLAPLGGRMRPVAFVDAGQAAAEDLLASQALVGGGVGLSLFNGSLRFDLSRSISPDLGGKLRFDLLVRAVR